VTLLVLTAAVGVAAAFALQKRGAEASDGPAPGPLFPGLSDRVNDVASLSVTTSEGKVSIQRDGDTWRVEERDGYPARFETVKTVLLGVADLQTLEPKTTRPELYGKLGLAEPTETGSDTAQLTLVDAGGSAMASVLVGHIGLQPNTLYVRRAGDSQTWLARGAIAPERQPTGWMDREVLKLPATRLQKVTIAQADGETVVVSREKAEDTTWTIQNVPDDSEPKSAGQGRTVAASLESLSFDDVAKAESKPLPADERATATFETFDGLRVVLTSGTADKKVWIAVQAAATDAADETVKKEAETLNTRLAPWVFEIPEYRGANLRRRLADLIKPKAPPVTPVAPDAAPAEGETPPAPPAADEPGADPHAGHAPEEPKVDAAVTPASSEPPPMPPGSEKP
jgi:hypothetical protein